MKKIAKEEVFILMLDKNRIDITKYREIKRHYNQWFSYSVNSIDNRYLITVENDTSVLSAYEGEIR